MVDKRMDWSHSDDDYQYAMFTANFPTQMKQMTGGGGDSGKKKTNKNYKLPKRI